MSDIDDADRLREDDDEDRDEFGRRDQSSPPTGAIALAKTLTVTTYPTATGKFLAVQIESLLGDDSAEGNVGVASVIGSTQYAYIPTGAPIPPTGSEVVIAFVPYRWTLVL